MTLPQVKDFFEKPHFYGVLDFCYLFRDPLYENIRTLSSIIFEIFRIFIGDAMPLLENIKKLCDEQGLNINQLEKIAGIKPRSISKWDKTMPSVDKAAKVAIALSVSIEELIDLPIPENKKTATNGDGEKSDIEIAFSKASKKQQDIIMRVLNMSELQQEAFLNLVRPDPSLPQVQDDSK